MKLQFKKLNAWLIVVIMVTQLLSGICVFAEESESIKLGDYIYLGQYNGERLVWRCVDIDENGPLMMLAETLENKGFAPSETGQPTDNLNDLDGLSEADMRMNYGTNRWSKSTLRQWLNSEDASVAWEEGVPSDEFFYAGTGYDGENGFLAADNFTEDEKYAIKTVVLKNILSEIDVDYATSGNEGYEATYSDVDIENYENAYSEETVDRIFCMDILQQERAKANFPEYVKAPSEAEQYWMRTPSYEKSYGVYYETMYNVAIDTVASNSNIGVRPACYINEEIINIQSGTGEEDSPFVIFGSAPVAIKEIILSQNQLTLGKGVSYKLEVGIVPENASDKSIYWSSEDETVAKVSSDGIITAVETGQTTIIAFTADKSVTAECTVIVTERQEVFFEDDIFKKAVIDSVLNSDRGVDEAVYVDEVNSVTELDVKNLAITSFAGIEHFTALETLNMSGNKAKEIDLTKNTNLTSVDCTNSQLISIDVSENTLLTRLFASQNNLTEINVSKNGNLVWLDVSDNSLTKIDLSSNKTLEYLYVSGNAIEKIDLSACPGIKSLECQNNRLTSLDLSKNKYMTNLNCSNNMLAELNVYNQSNLIQLLAKENRLKTIDISNNKFLSYIDCSRNYFGAQSDVVGYDENRTTLVYYPQYIVLIDVESVNIKEESVALEMGDTVILTAEVLPQGATNKNVKWSSDNTAIANVSENGRVTAYSPGKCTITATTDDGGFTDTCEIEVLDHVKPTVPTNVAVDYVTGSGVKVSWTASDDNVGVLRYDVYRNDKFLKSVTQTSFTDSKLSEGTKYVYKIVAVDLSENKSDYTSSVTVVPASPVINRVQPTTGSTFGGEGTARISVYYNNTNNSFGATLSIEYKNESGQWEAAPFDITCSQATSGSYNIIHADFEKDSLETGDYNFKITLKDRDNHSDSIELLYSVDRTAPKKIEDFAATAGEENIILSWAVARDADVEYYEIYRAGTLEGTYQLYYTVYGRTNTSYTDKNVYVDEVYYYKILAVDAYGQKGELTDPIWSTSTVDNTIPTVTRFLPANNSKINAKTTISVTAQDNIMPEEILLQYSTDESNWVDYAKVATDSSANFDFDTTNLKDGKVYLRAIAYDTSGNESNGRPVYTYTVDNTGPSKVIGVALAGATSTTLTLSWKDVPETDFGYFCVEQKNEKTGEYSSVGTTSTTLGMNIYALAPESEYTYRVVAYDSLGNRGVESDDITVTTLADTTAPVITSIYPNSNRYASQIPLRIAVGDDYLVDKLDIEYSYDLKTWKKETQITATRESKEYTFSYTFNLADKNEGSLYIRPVAYDKVGNVSDKSSAAPFVEYYVDRTPPAKPTGFTATGTHDYIELSWKQGEEEDLAGYVIYRSDTANGEYSVVRSNLQQVNYIDTNAVHGKTYYYKIAVKDTTGNISPITEYVYAQMLDDIEKPVIYSFSPSNGYVITKSTPVNILVGDNHMVESLVVEYKTSEEGEWLLLEEKMPNITSGIVSISINKDIFTDGDYYFRAMATDAGGNVGDYSDTYKYTIDTVAPVVDSVRCTPGEESITVSWTGNMEDDLSGYYIYRKTRNGSYSRIGSASAKDKTEYEYTDYNLNADTQYMYKVVAIDVVGNQSGAESNWIYPEEIKPESDTISPQIFMSVVSVMEVDVEEYFDASSSIDNIGIVSYLWDFGDGTTSPKANVAHSYSAAGTYTVKLIVADAAGNRSEKTTLVTVEERKKLGSVTIEVKDTYGDAVVGAGVYFNLGSENVSIYGTDSNGQVTVRDYEGMYAVGVYADGYLPAKINAQIIKNSDDIYTVVIEKKEIVVGELTHTRMTLDEIIAAGIDPYKPENQNVYKFEIVLTYGTEKYTASGITNNTSDPVRLTVSDSASSVGRNVYIWNIGGGSGGSGGSYTKTPKPIIAVIEIPGEASWLKEFFDVHLHIENQADEEFAIDDCVVTLNYPKNGLTLMTGVVDKYSETQTVNIGTLAGQEEKDLHWILRGDEAGEYDISADFEGTLRDFNEEVSATFKAKDPIEVYGSNNLFLDIMVEDSIAPNSDCAIRVGITNEGPVDVYLPNISLSDLEFIRNFKTLNNMVVKTDMDTLAPGESLWADYRIPRSVEENLINHADKEFYLYSAIVKSIGGNVKMKHRFNVVPAYTISPDIINVYTKDATGALSPLSIIETSRGMKTKIPDIVIETLSFDENMQLVPASREVTIVDDYLVKNGRNLENVYGLTNLSEDGKKFTVKTGSDGRVTLSGYDIKYVFSTMDPFNITITSPRAVKRQIPVVMRDGKSETTVVEGHVYYNANGAITPISDAEIIIGDKVDTTDKDGKFYFKAIALGANSVTVKKDGYAEVNTVLTVSENAEVDYYLNELQDDTVPHITSVQNTTFNTKSGNTTIIPEGKVQGYVQFLILNDLMGEEFVKYKYYKLTAEGEVKEEGEFFAGVYSCDIKDMKTGERLLFSLVTRNGADMEKESPMFDTNIVIVDAPNFLENIALSVNDLDDLGKFEEFSLGKSLPVMFTTEKQQIKEQALFKSQWIKTDDEEAEQAFYMLEGLQIDSKTETTFPLKAEYNLDGTFKISFGVAKAYKPQSVSYYESVGDYNAYSNGYFSIESSSSSTYAEVIDLSELSEGDDKALDIGGDAKLDLTIKYDPTIKDWQCVLGITVTGKAKAKVFKVQAPVFYGVAGGYATVDVGGDATVRWETIKTKLSDIFGEAEFNPSPLPEKLNAGIEAEGSAGVYAVDSDVVSAGGYAKLNADVHLLPQQKMVLGYEFGLEGKVLLWEPQKSLLDDKFEFRFFDDDQQVDTQSLMQLFAEEDKALNIVEIPTDREWNSQSGELIKNVFSGSKHEFIKLDENRAMLIFADYGEDRDENNPVVMKYSIFEDNVWSQPAAIYDDLTVDLYPEAFVSNNNVYVTWINISRELADATSMTVSKMRSDVFTKMEVVMSVFDNETGEWSSPTVVAESGRFKKSPQIATDGDTVLNAWVVNDANIEYGTEEYPDKIGYSFTGGYNDEGVLDVSSGIITSLSVAALNQRGYVIYTRPEEGVNKAFYRVYSGQWSEENRINTNVYEDKHIRIFVENQQVYIYFVNNNKIYRYNTYTDETECITSDDAIANITNFEVIDNSLVVWSANCSGKTEVFITKNDDGVVSTINVDVQNYDGLIKYISAINNEGNVLVSTVENTFINGEISNVFSVHTVNKTADIKILNVMSDNALIPGISNELTVSVHNGGFAAADGFKVYCSSTENTENAFGEPYEYVKSLDAGRSTTVIMNVPVPAEYNQSYVYVIVEDSLGNIKPYKAEIVYDIVKINEVKKESTVPTKMNFKITVDNYGFVNHDDLKVIIKDDASEEIIAESAVGELVSNTSSRIEMLVDFGDEESKICLVEVVRADGTVLDSMLVDVSESDYKILLGDYYCDGEVNPADATSLLQAIAYETEETQRQKIAGDINENEDTELNDVVAILQYCAGIVDSFK